MTPQAELDVSRKTRRSVIVILMLIALASVTALFFASLSYFRSSEINEANNRLSLYRRSLNDALERFQHFPFVLARDPHVIGAYAENDRDDLNKRLAAFASESGLEAIYVMDTDGLVLAASNYDAPVTFLGKNYGFRPYFENALEGTRGEFFGVGATTGRPGYFVSEPVRGPENAVAGVVAIKLDMSELQKTWEGGGERVFVSNSDGIIVLASTAAWLYRTLTPLSAEQEAKIKRGRQFGTKPLDPFDWSYKGDGAATVEGRTFIHVTAPAERLGWTVHYLLSDRRVVERATLATVILGLALSALLIVGTYLRSQRIQAALRVSQADRHQLRAANEELEAAQEELARTSKMAAFGQLSASVTHELGQPLSAMRNYIAAAEIGKDINPDVVMQKLKTCLHRMESVTSQLRFFAKPGEKQFTPVLLPDICAGALEMVEHDMNAAGVQLETDFATTAGQVLGDRHRLEQVIVNFAKNAITAMADTKDKVLTVSVKQHGTNAAISVQDTGNGLGGQDLKQLQEPFHTTQASGDGMGLGLAIATEIIKEHGGQLSAKNNDAGGACFTMSLPLAPVGHTK